VEALVASRDTAKKNRADVVKREGTSPSPTEEIETTQILFRNPAHATGATREIALTNEYKPEKRHPWLDINI
jgi:hypothetical protein